jgi:hypothetical protein
MHDGGTILQTDDRSAFSAVRRSRRSRDAAAQRLRHAGRARKGDGQARKRPHGKVGKGLRFDRGARPTITSPSVSTSAASTPSREVPLVRPMARLLLARRVLRLNKIPDLLHHPYDARDRAIPEHDPEKWTPVFGKDHAQTKC